MRSGYKKAAIISAILAGIAVSGYLLISSYREAADTERELEAAGDVYRTYSAKIRELENQMKEKKEETGSVEEGYIILAFSGEDPDLTDGIYPALEEFGLNGTLVVSAEKLPGTQSADLTMDSVQMLKDSGWDLALGGAVGEDVQEYAGSVEEAWTYLRDSGLGTVQALMFNGGDYAAGRETLYPVISELGFRLCGAFSSQGRQSSLISKADKEYPQIYNCQNVSLREEAKTVKTMIKQAEEQREPLILSDYTLERTWEVTGEGIPENLQEILLYLQEEQVQTGNVGDYLEYTARTAQKKEEKQREYQKFEEKCKAEIAALRQKQAEIRKQNRRRRT